MYPVLVTSSVVLVKLMRVDLSKNSSVVLAQINNSRDCSGKCPIVELDQSMIYILVIIIYW